jgi:lysyl-tRNA synthetase class 2
MSDNYEDAFGHRIAVAELDHGKSGMIAGLVHCESGSWVVEETSGTWTIPEALCEPLELGCYYWGTVDQVPHAPQWVHLQKKVRTAQIEPLLLGRSRHRKRWAIHEAVEAFFREQYFVKADTPVWVSNPGMEPFLDTYAVGSSWLRTSPELHLKRLLAAGHDRLFQIAPCFRKGDVGRWHREEFLMLEWYRLFAGLPQLIEDLGGLLQRLAPLSVEPDYWMREIQVISVVDLFKQRLDLALADCHDVEPLREALQARKFKEFDAGDDWNTLFHLLFLNYIEPELGADQPVVVINYPASQSALARLGTAKDGVMPHCLRFELFVKGIELANAFDELTDAQEQRRRHESDREERLHMGKPQYSHDEAFLDALTSGIPRAAGIALGLDRLVALLLGGTALDEVLPFEAVT